MLTPAPVLIVESNPHMTAMLQRFLTRQQVDVQAVYSPADAHAALAQQAFPVVLTEAWARSGDGSGALAPYPSGRPRHPGDPHDDV